MDDEEEDFLDECLVNPTGTVASHLNQSEQLKIVGQGCPTVLLLCAATLLTEITAYMRETYKSVPKQVVFNLKMIPGNASLMSLEQSNEASEGIHCSRFQWRWRNWNWWRSKTLEHSNSEHYWTQQHQPPEPTSQ